MLLGFRICYASWILTGCDCSDFSIQHTVLVVLCNFKVTHTFETVWLPASGSKQN